MRYSEKEQDRDSGLLQKILTIITAPTRFLNEVMVKVVFLPRKLIEEILLVAIGLGSIATALDFFISKFVSGKGWLDGRFPVLYRVIAILLIAIFYLFYELHEFNIYKQINSLVELHNAPKTELDNTGIAASLLNDDDDDAEQEMAGMTKIDLDEGEDTDHNSATPINAEMIASTLTVNGGMPLNLTLDSSLLYDSSISNNLDEAFPNINLEPASLSVEATGVSSELLSDVEPKLDLSSLSNIPKDGKDVPIEKSAESVIQNPDALPKAKIIESLAGNKDVIDYQDKLYNCINGLLSAGLTYEGDLSTESIAEIDHLLDVTPLDGDYGLDPLVSEKLGDFAEDNTIDLADIQKTWKMPVDSMDLI